MERTLQGERNALLRLKYTSREPSRLRVTGGISGGRRAGRLKKNDKWELRKYQVRSK